MNTRLSYKPFTQLTTYNVVCRFCGDEKRVDVSFRNASLSSNEGFGHAIHQSIKEKGWAATSIPTLTVACSKPRCKELLERGKKMKKLIMMIEIVLGDNELLWKDIPEKVEIPEGLFEQAEKCPEEEMEDFCIGEMTDSSRIAAKYGLQGVSNFLDSLV